MLSTVHYIYILCLGYLHLFQQYCHWRDCIKYVHVTLPTDEGTQILGVYLLCYFTLFISDLCMYPVILLLIKSPGNWGITVFPISQNCNTIYNLFLSWKLFHLINFCNFAYSSCNFYLPSFDRTLVDWTIRGILHILAGSSWFTVSVWGCCNPHHPK